MRLFIIDTIEVISIRINSKACEKSCKAKRTCIAWRRNPTSASDAAVLDEEHQMMIPTVGRLLDWKESGEMIEVIGRLAGGTERDRLCDVKGTKCFSLWLKIISLRLKQVMLHLHTANISNFLEVKSLR